jgi:hypothetical protein
MGPYVAVEVAPERADESALRAMLDACSGALPRGECVSAAELPRSESPAAIAVVNWTDELHVHLQVRVEASRPSTRVRDLTFSVKNPRPERFRSVGLAIATMADEFNVSAHLDDGTVPATADTTRQASPASDSVQAVAASPVPAATAPPYAANAPAGSANVPAGSEQAAPTSTVVPNANASESRRFAFEAGALVGSGAAGAPRLGPFARVTYDVQPAFYVGAGFTSSFRTASSVPAMSWNELLFGGGARTSAGEVRVEGGVDVAVVSTAASAPSPVAGVSDRQNVWVPGVAFEGRLGWPARSALAVTLGVRAMWLAKAVVVTNAGEEVARVPAYNVGGTLGARFAF